MRSIFTHILVFGFLLSYGQEANKYILLRDRIGNPIPGATLTISRNNTNILTNRTDLDGFAYLMINDFDYISIWFMGFDKPKLDSTVFKSDTTLIILDEARYQTPKLLIKKNEFQIDSSEYCSFIRDTIIEYHGDCSCVSIRSATYFANGRIRLSSPAKNQC